AASMAASQLVVLGAISTSSGRLLLFYPDRRRYHLVWWQGNRQLRKGMRMAGYSGTPLAKKLGIKPGARVYVENAPEHYLALLEPLPADVFFSPGLTGAFELIHLFTKEARGLTTKLQVFQRVTVDEGARWVSWLKTASN